MSDSELYVGYRRHAPKKTARFVTWTSGALLLVALGLAATLAASQNEPAKATFEFGIIQSFEGRLTTRPYPILKPTDNRSYLIVAPFKHGADAYVDSLDGRFVRFEGTLIYRGHRRMIELVPESISVAPETAARAEADTGRSASEKGIASGNEISVRGEILDSKCWLGVMKPGSGTVHRACARLCIRGGIPPMIGFRDASGDWRTALVTAKDGSALSGEILGYVGRPILVTGRYNPQAAAGFGTLSIDPAMIRFR